MKQLLFIFLLAGLCAACFGQAINRRINFNPIDRDSLDLSLNSNYNLIEDSCAQIIRHARFNFDTRKFHGKFTDVSKQNPATVLTEGSYSADGLKDGPFIIRYENGNTMAKGNFKDDTFDGKWEIFYDDGKPQLTFEVKDGVYSITGAWDARGNKTIDKGNGNYLIDLSFFCWKGKLVNGKPDGAWKMYRANDPYKETTGTEHFKNGEFTGGENQLGKYTNASRISLVNTAGFKFINAEKMFVGTPCDLQAVSNRVVVDAHFKSGRSSLKFHLQDALTAYIKDQNLEEIAGSFFIVGDVDLTGHIVNLKKGGGYIANIERGVIAIIEGLPELIPATVDGKPVIQQFKISLEVTKYGYSGSFQFLPIRHK